MYSLQICHYLAVATDKNTYFLKDVRDGRMCFISNDEMNYIHDHMSCEACDFIWRYRMREHARV